MVIKMKFNFIRFFRMILKKYNRDNCCALAAQITYSAILGLFPFILIAMSILTLTDFDLLYTYNAFGTIIPLDLFNNVTSILNETTKIESISVLTTGFILLIYSASQGIHALLKAANYAYNIRESRSFLQRQFISLILTLTFPIIILLNSILFIIIYFILEKINLSLVPIGGILCSAWLVFSIFTILFMLLPNIKVTFKKAVPGALFSTIAWIVITFIFGIYYQIVEGMKSRYGIIGIIIMLLIWLNLSIKAILAGLELNSFVAIEGWKNYN